VIRTFLTAATLVLLLVLAGCGSDTSTDSSGKVAPCTYTKGGSTSDVKVKLPPGTPPKDLPTSVTIRTSAGDIPVTLDADKAPCAVNSLVSLAKQGYFDQTRCHRLTTQGYFVLQCGDPTGTGRGGPGYTIPDELHGTEAYGPGTLAMANTGQPNSGGSQFFIVYKDSTAGLQKLYTVFGQLDKASLAVVQKVAAKGSDNSNGPGDGAPKEPVTITKVSSGG
jgi:peptidyl-prolyl cis-trans isomerase B (cyclophilin B)